MRRSLRHFSSAAAFPKPLFFRAAGSPAPLSPFHDIPLRTATPGVFNAVIEIPLGGRAKMEIDTGAPFNPIIQDATKAKAPRSYFLDSLSNYGALPQTYEDPQHKDAWMGLLGDGDPLDVCDISSRPQPTGSVYGVKVLGALGMIGACGCVWGEGGAQRGRPWARPAHQKPLPPPRPPLTSPTCPPPNTLTHTPQLLLTDGGEADWKILAVRTDDPLAKLAEDVEGAGCPDAVKRAMDDISACATAAPWLLPFARSPPTPLTHALLPLTHAQGNGSGCTRCPRARARMTLPLGASGWTARPRCRSLTPRTRSGGGWWRRGRRQRARGCQRVAWRAFARCLRQRWPPLPPLAWRREGGGERRE
jgi:inorganic pyrophosphatase